MSTARMKTWIVEVHDPSTGDRKTYNPIRAITESGADAKARERYLGPLASSGDLFALETAVNIIPNDAN